VSLDFLALSGFLMHKIQILKKHSWDRILRGATTHTDVEDEGSLIRSDGKSRKRSPGKFCVNAGGYYRKAMDMLSGNFLAAVNVPPIRPTLGE
jgi:hypothetical protein